MQLRESKLTRKFEDSTFQEQQVPIFASEAKEDWVFGGNRSGKSDAGAKATLIQATGIVPKSIRDIYKKKIRIPSDSWVCSIDYPNSRDVAQKKILAQLPGDMRKRWDERNHLLELTNGSKIGFKSYDSGPIAFQGPDKDFIWKDEEPPKDINDECDFRLADRGGYSITTMTPTQGITWVYNNVYLKREDNKDTVRCFFLNTELNEYLNKEEVERLKKKHGDNWKMRGRGEFISKTGQIFAIDRLINVCKPFPIPKDWNRYRVIDPGIGHATGCLWVAVSPLNRRFYYREYLIPDLNIPQNAKAIIDMSNYPNGTKEEFLANIIDPNSGEARAIGSGTTARIDYSVNGIPCLIANDNVDMGIDMVKQSLMMLADGFSRSMIFDTNVKQIDTMLGYVWGAKRMDGIIYGTGKPKKINDELPDCTRYFEMYNPDYFSPAELASYSGEEQGVVNSVTGY